jgi:two-component system OmpR family response regulator
VGNQQRSALVRPDGTAARVLIVEDEPSLAELLSSVLRGHGWTIECVSSGHDAIRTVRSFEPDAVLLDLGLSDIDGLEVLRQIRAHDRNLAVVILTARDDTDDRSATMLCGASDFITKPFSIADVLDRVGFALRCRGLSSGNDSSCLVIGDFSINEARREVRRGGTPIALTSIEFELLLVLSKNEGVALSRQQIIDRVWHYDFGAQSHIVELYISVLRAKIDADREPLIHTVAGGGYSLCANQP